MYELIERLLEVSIPPQLADDEMDHRFFAAALLSRCRGLLRATVLLSKADMLSLSAGLVRQIFEHAAVGLWLLEKPDFYFALTDDYRRRYRVLAASWPDEFANDYASMLETFGPESDGAKYLLPLDQRLVEGLETHYAWYRQLCLYDHPGLQTAHRTMRLVSARLEITDDPPPPSREQRWLAYAAFHVALFSHKVQHSFNHEGCEPYFDLTLKITDELHRWQANTEPGEFGTMTD